VLAELAGSAQNLRSGCLISNPWNTEELAVTIRDAMTVKDLTMYPYHVAPGWLSLHGHIQCASVTADKLIQQHWSDI